MGAPQSGRCLGTAIAALLIAGVLVVPIVASAQETKTWAAQSDFESGQLIDLDASSSPGHLLLSKHPTNWTRYAGNPVLGPQPGSWDPDWIAVPDVMYEGGLFKMWYQGCAGQTCDIGYATSSDGIHWIPYSGNPVLRANPSAWDATLGTPRVIHDGATYRMWYAGNGPNAIRIGYATSSDGVTWSRYASWPVFNGTMSWDTVAVATPAVLKVGSTFLLYFSGASGSYSYSMGLATSTDGAHWTEDPANPLLVPRLPWESYRVHPSAVVAGPSGYELYYTGASNVGFDHDTAIGYATSPDGRNWTEDASNPILTWGPTGAWDGSNVAHPYPVVVGTETRLYYTGYNSSVLQIGFAVRRADQFAYDPVGTWSSAVFDSGDANTTWDRLSWVAATPPDTAVGAAVLVGNTSQPDWSWSLPGAPALSSPVSLHLPKARYAQVIVALATVNESASPDLSQVALAFTRPAPPTPGLSDISVLGIPLIVFLLLIPPVALGVLLLALLLRSRGRPSARMPSVPPVTAKICPRCGASSPLENRFCPTCGQPFVASPENPPAPR